MNSKRAEQFEQSSSDPIEHSSSDHNFEFFPALYRSVRIYMFRFLSWRTAKFFGLFRPFFGFFKVFSTLITFGCGCRFDKWTIQVKDRIVVDDPLIEWEDVEVRVDKEFVNKKRWNV